MNIDELKAKSNISPEHFDEACRRAGTIPVRPLGTCFDSCALEFFEHHEQMGPDAKVVHGIGTTNMPGQEGNDLCHAWIDFNIEKERMSYDAIWGIAVSHDEFRKQFKVRYEVSYAWPEFISNWIATDMPGPWDITIVEKKDQILKNKNKGESDE